MKRLNRGKLLKKQTKQQKRLILPLSLVCFFFHMNKVALNIQGESIT